MNTKKWLANTKVVDSNGNPLILYHGSEVAWRKYDNSKAPNNHSTYANANHIYFSTKKEVAATYLENYPVYKDVPFETLKLFTPYKDIKQNINYFAEYHIDGTPTGKGLPPKELIQTDFGYYFEEPLHGVLEDIPHFNPNIIGSSQYFAIMNQLPDGTFNIDDFKRYEAVYHNGNPKIRGTHNLTEDVIYAYQHGEDIRFEPKGVVRAFYVNLENPFIVDARGNNAICPFIDSNGELWGQIGESLSERYTPIEAIEEYAKYNDYDGVIVKNIEDIGSEPRDNSISMIADTVIAFSPSQIKLIPNKELKAIQTNSNAITSLQEDTLKPTIVFHKTTSSSHDMSR